MTAFILRACLFVAVWYIGYVVGVNHERSRQNESTNKINMDDINMYIEHAVTNHLSNLGEFVDSKELTDEDSKKMNDFHEFVKDLDRYAELMKIVGDKNNTGREK